MAQLHGAVFALVSVGAVLAIIGLGIGLFELETGRLSPMFRSIRRRIPATPVEVRRNALALVLNQVAALLLDLAVVGTLLLSANRPQAFVAAAYLVVTTSAVVAAFTLSVFSLTTKRRVHYLSRAAARVPGETTLTQGPA